MELDEMQLIDMKNNYLEPLSRDEVELVSGGNPLVVIAVVATVRWAAPRVVKAVVAGVVGGGIAALVPKR